MRKKYSSLFVVFFSIIFLMSGINIVQASQLDMMSIDYPQGPTSNSADTVIRGWALTSSGLSKVSIYVDGKYLHDADIHQSRPDVSQVYPGYIDGDNAGYKYILPKNTLSAGTHTLKVVAYGKDGSSQSREKQFSLYGLQDNMSIDYPQGESNETEDTVVRGWALTNSGINKVSIYVDGKYLHDADIHQSRPDVGVAYPGYIDGDNAGYKYVVPKNTLPAGNHTVKVVAYGNDGRSQSRERIFKINAAADNMSIDSPHDEFNIHEDTIVRGWAITASGLNKVQIYVDGKYLHDADIHQSRPDVGVAYPGYIDGDNAGYKYTIAKDTLSAGNHTVKVIAIANDGTSQSSEAVFSIIDLPAKICLDTPQVDDYMTKSNQTINIRGWAINWSGLSKAQISVDGAYLGDATTGILRTDVEDAYPKYKDSDKSGFTYTMSTSGLSQGNHLITITAYGNDGSTCSTNYTIKVVNVLPIKASLDSPNNTAYNYGANTFNMHGWVINDTSIKNVQVYIDDKYICDAQINVSREDVGEVYTQYPNSNNSGFTADIATKTLAGGNHQMKVIANGNDGQSITLTTNFSLTALIVIDPGHNYGGDDGAYGYVNGTTYCERDLNMQLALKLNADLVKMGFRTILTRQESDGSTDDVVTSLGKRVDIANKNNADLFISIHHDASNDPSSQGVSTHWSSYRPNIDNSGLVTKDDVVYDTTPSVPAIKSSKLAESLVNNLASLGYKNGGSRDHNLYVTKNTNMPSVLVEAGFITNPDEAKKTADYGEQWRVADSIANTINAYFKSN